MTMLARQEEYYEEEAHVLTPAEEKVELRKTPKEPLFKTVLDTRLRTHGQLLFLTMTVLALLVTVGSGISASRGYELVAIQQQADQLEQENDTRLTNFGRTLRKHHLDELPQVWNVLKGDMSFVGYRPERKYFIDQILVHNPDYQLLYQVSPGVTSAATIQNGYTDTMEKMLRRLDMEQRRRWSMDRLHQS